MSGIPVGRRFRSAVPDNDRLLELVADIARAVDTDPVWAMTQRHFDEERLAAAIACPSARQVRRRLRRPWRQAVCDALDVPLPELAPPALRTHGLRHGPYTRADCLAALGAYLAGLDPTDPPTIRGYRTWCHQAPGRPWPQSLRRHGGFRALLAAARRPDRAPIACPVDELLTASRSPLAARILSVIDDAHDWLTCEQIAARTGADRRCVADRLRRLEQAGAIDRIEFAGDRRARWMLAPSGRQWLWRRARAYDQRDDRHRQLELAAA